MYKVYALNRNIETSTHNHVLVTAPLLCTHSTKILKYRPRNRFNCFSNMLPHNHFKEPSSKRITVMEEGSSFSAG